LTTFHAEDRASPEPPLCHRFIQAAITGRYNLSDELFRIVNAQLAENGAKVWRGIVVDATIIHAPSSIKNKHKQRNPKMRRNHRVRQWYFRMKAHIGVDSRTKLFRFGKKDFAQAYSDPPRRRSSDLQIPIGEPIAVTVVYVKGNQGRLATDPARHLPMVREESLEESAGAH
jgi:hypothetical protein